MDLSESIDIRAFNKWSKAGISYNNYCAYIERKPDRFHITFVDLLYISNFKGGNATINELESDINFKLHSYSVLMKKIELIFYNRKLSDLDEGEVLKLSSMVNGHATFMKTRS